MPNAQLTISLKILRDLNGKRVAKFTLAREVEENSFTVAEFLGTEAGLSMSIHQDSVNWMIHKSEYYVFREHLFWMLDECDRIFSPEALAPKTYTVDISHKPKKKKTSPKTKSKMNDQRHNPKADLTKYPPEVYNVPPPSPVAGGFDQQGIGVFTNIDRKDHDEYGKKGVIEPLKEQK